MAKKSELTEKLEPVTEAVKETTEKVIDAAKAAAKAAEPAVKRAAKKAEPAVKKAEKAVKETGRKAAGGLVPTVYVQWMGKELDCAELVEKARADFKAQHKGAIRSCKLYIKPEDGVVYYVINGKEGKVEL